MQTRCVQIANTVFHSCHQCDNIDRLNKYKQQITNNLQLYSCARSQHAHANWVNWLNIITNNRTSGKQIKVKTEGPIVFAFRLTVAVQQMKLHMLGLHGRDTS